MIRVVIENILLFLLPAAMYVGYVLLTRRGSTSAGTVVSDAPLVWLDPGLLNFGQLNLLGSNNPLANVVPKYLLYGSVASDSRWLSFGDAPGQPQKVFQFGDETVIPVQVRGQHLRAGIRPLEGQLVIDSMRSKTLSLKKRRPSSSLL